MLIFFTFDATILLAFVLLGALVVGGSIKEIAGFIVDEIHIVYPVFVAILAVFLLVYYVVSKSGLKKLPYNSTYRKERELVLDRRMIVFLINSPFVVLSPVSAIYSMAVSINNWGFGGFIIALLMSFFYLLCIYLILRLFLKAWEWADENSESFGRIKMFLVSIAFLVIQFILYVVTTVGSE